MSLEEHADIVRLRNDFFRDYYFKIVNVFFICLIIIAGLVSIIIYIQVHVPTPKYFPMDKDQSLLKKVPLDKPNQPDALVLQWINQAIVAAFSFNYIDYQTRLVQLSNYFTPIGWQNYLQQLQQSNNLNTLVLQKMIMHAEAVGAPIILEQGVIDGQYSWQIRMPIMVTLEAANVQRITQFMQVTVLATRTAVTDSTPQGLAVVQFVATNMQQNAPS